MILRHTVNHIPEGAIARSIEQSGLRAQVETVYPELVPEGIRHLPVVWLVDGFWQTKTELPIFEVDTEDLDGDKLYHLKDASVSDLKWYVYQGDIGKVSRYKEIE